MQAWLTLTAAALCLSQVQPAVAGDEPVRSPVLMKQGSVYEKTLDLHPHPAREESFAEAPWEAGHNLALIVTKHESRHPPFDVSASVALITNAH